MFDLMETEEHSTEQEEHGEDGPDNQDEPEHGDLQHAGFLYLFCLMVCPHRTPLESYFIVDH